jgi:hypothetical protein
MKTLVMTRPPTLLQEQACIVLARWIFAAFRARALRAALGLLVAVPTAA